MYGVSGNKTNDIKQTKAGLQKEELWIKNNDAILMRMGTQYKKSR
jgi:hypothetical protein